MVPDIIRDAPLGGWLRLTSWGRKLLPYPEELPDFVVPEKYKVLAPSTATGAQSPADTLVNNVLSPDATLGNKAQTTSEKQTPPSASGREAADAAAKLPAGTKVKRTLSGSQGLEGGHVPERSFSLMTEQEKRRFIPPGTILVEWYSDTDPAHPWNWSGGKHAVVGFLILWLTFCVYAGSSLVTSSFPGLQEKFGVGNAEVTTTLSVYVFAYGFGALLFSPLSEIPSLGRNPFYSYPMILFVLFQIGCAKTETFYTFCIMRFLTGLMGAPFLATAGASLQDAFTPDKLGALIAFWALSAFAAPSIAPTYGNYAAVYLESYHWPMWLLLIQAGFATALLLIFLPETSHNYILLNRAKRLRALTGNKNIRSMAEIELAHLTANEVITKAIVRPTEIFLKDPAITYAHLYTAIIYGIYYLFFESYPLVYQGIYGFSFQVSALGYLAFLVGGLIACISYLAYCAVKFGPIFKAGKMPEPEQWLDASLVSTVIPPIGVFLFAWTARESVHWSVSLVGVMIFGGANFVTIQCIFAYVLSVYPAYGASLLAGNDFLRSSTAAGLLFAGQPMFKAMGIGGGNSFLAGLLILGTVGAYVIWYFGATLRARSKFTG